MAAAASGGKPRKKRLLTAKDVYKELAGMKEETPAAERTSAFRKIRNILFMPHQFFEQLAKGKGMDGSVGFMMTMTAISAIYFGMSWLMLNGGMAAAAQLAIYQYVFMIFLTVLSSAATHLLVRLLGGKGDLKTTFKTVVYAGTPWYLFAAVPILAIVSLAWSFYLEVIGLKGTQKLKTFPAIVAAIAPFALLLLAMIIYVANNPALLEQIANMTATGP